MADIQQDGRTNKYGPATKDTEGLTVAMVHAAQLGETFKVTSDQTLPELTSILNERGMLFSKDRRYAIFLQSGVLQLRKSRKPEGYAAIIEKPCGELYLSRLDLLSLFELMERDNYASEYPGREEWS